MSEDTLNILLLIAALLMLFIGFAPIVSMKIYDELYKDLWRDKTGPFSKFFSEGESYIYNRYFRQVWLLGFGFLLGAFSLWRMFFE